MDTAQIDEILRTTLEDHRLSRGEKRLVHGLLGELGRTEQSLAFVRHRAFELARHEMAGPQSHAIVTWLEDVVKLLVPEPPTALPLSEAAFSPGDDCAQKIVNRLYTTTRISKIVYGAFTAENAF